MRNTSAGMVLGVALWATCVGAAQAEARHIESLNPGWHFLREDVADGGAVTREEKNWEAVSLPHSYNVADGSNSHTYYRGPAWYRRTFDVAKIAGGQRTYIEFDGAMLASDVWLNGVKVGRHEGGFARFRFDLTPNLKTGRNSLAVRVDNAKLPDGAPLGGDYTVYGGIYRSARLVTTKDVHFDMLDYGGSGVYFKSPQVSAQKASLNWTARVANDRDQTAQATVIVYLADATGKVVQNLQKTVSLAPRSVQTVFLDGEIDHPHLWQGVDDPYLYTATAELRTDAGKPSVLDDVTFQVGIRDVRIDADKGVFLNGKPYQVHGVNIHQAMRLETGTAVSEADMDADFKMLEDLGVTGLRFAHYQHPPHEYDIADRKGFLVWTELPMISEVIGTQAFEANLVQQLRELIRQNVNHPSVFVWGLGNEVYKVDANSGRLLDAMNALAHAEDSSRPTTYANCCSEIDGPQASHTDIIGSNVYFGWYTGEFADLGPWLDSNHKRRPTTPEAISEYGAGASVYQQEDPPRRPVPASAWHPEQYQALYHEAAWRQLLERPWLWANFVWVGFDFPSVGRNEGDHAGFNDKGLITYDRQFKKDAYFWYQSNWTTKPMLYITSRRAVQRAAAEADIKIYSNQPTVRLSLNGVDLGERAVSDHVASWHVTLAPGANHIEARTGTLTDAVDWTWQPSSSPAKPTGPQ